jgi:hypothetical protein
MMMMATTNTISAMLNKTISMLSITTMLYLLAFRSLISKGSKLLTPVPHDRHSREIRRRLAPVVFSDPPGRVSSNPTWQARGFIAGLPAQREEAEVEEDGQAHAQDDADRYPE